MKININDIKSYYNNKLWTINMVRMAVRKNIITKEQFKSINADATEIVKMLTSTIKTTRQNNS